MKRFITTAEENVNIQNKNDINKYIIQHMQEMVSHNLQIFVRI